MFSRSKQRRRVSIYTLFYYICNFVTCEYIIITILETRGRGEDVVRLIWWKGEREYARGI